MSHDRSLPKRAYQSYYEIRAPFGATVTSADLNQFISDNDCQVSDSNFNYGGRLTVVVTNSIRSASTEHIVWKCRVNCNGKTYDFVCKLKKQDDAVYLLSRQHAESMFANFQTVGSVIDGFKLRAIRVAKFFVCQVNHNGQIYYIWFEEFLPGFRKFLMPNQPPHLSTSQYLTLSVSLRVQQLQMIMLGIGESPLIDAQGAVLPNGIDNVLVLSDIETARSLSKFTNIDEEECIRAIQENYCR